MLRQVEPATPGQAPLPRRLLPEPQHRVLEADELLERHRQRPAGIGAAQLTVRRAQRPGIGGEERAGEAS